MKKQLFWVILILCVFLIRVPVNAGIYSWTDENGVRHFSNAPPAAAVSDVSEQGEIEYDAQKDRERMIKEEAYHRREIRSAPEPSEEKDLSPREKEKIDRECRATWNGMRRALKKGKINKAMKYFHPSSREQYRKAFQELSKSGNK